MSQQNFKTDSTCGGIDLDVLINHLCKLNVWRRMGDHFGDRHPRAEYTVSDVYKTWIANVISGSRRLENTKEFRKHLGVKTNLKKEVSPDTISKVFRSLAVENTYYAPTDKKKIPKGLKAGQFVFAPSDEEIPFLNEVNDNEKFNALLLDIAIELGLFEQGKAYDLDLDATEVPTKVSDGRKNYRYNVGYFPIVVILGGIPIYMEARNGNSAPRFRNKQVLEKAINLIQSKGLRIKLVRIDAAGGSHSVFNFLNSRNIKFCIRPSENLRKNIKGPSVVNELQELIDLSRRFFRSKPRGRKIYWFDYYGKNPKPGNKRRIFGMVTNTNKIARTELIKRYNARGTHEQRFADLKEMGWDIMVHRELKYNSVHMYNTMIVYLFFLYSKRWLTSKIPDIKDTLEPQTFIRVFMAVVAIYKNHQISMLSQENRIYGPIAPT